MSKGIGPVQKKILLLLAAGASLTFAQTPGRYFRTIGALTKEWRKINAQSRRMAIKRLYESKLTEYREHANGRIEMVLSENGKRQTLIYTLEELSIPIPARWDGKWRIVLFDIPETQKKAREAFRFHMKRLGFHRFQKSAFVIPYECRRELDFLIELYALRPFVRIITAFHIDTAPHLKQIFGV